MAAVFLTCARISKVGARALVRGLKPVLLIILFTGILNLFFTPGDYLVQFGVLHISRQGLEMAVRMVLRIMKTAVIIDCIVAAVLFGFLVYGAWRGLFRSVVGLLMVILALTGAMFAARELTPMATKLLRPVIETSVAQRVDDALNGGASSQADSSPAENGDSVTPVKPQAGSDTSEDQTASTYGGAAVSSGDSSEDGAQTRLQAGELLKLMGWDDTLTKSLADRAQEKVQETGISLAMCWSRTIRRRWTGLWT